MKQHKYLVAYQRVYYCEYYIEYAKQTQTEIIIGNSTKSIYDNFYENHKHCNLIAITDLGEEA